MKTMKKIFPLFLAFVLFTTSVLPAFATDEDSGSTGTTKVFSTKDGYVVIEAEDTTYSTNTEVVEKQDFSAGSGSVLRLRTKYEKAPKAGETLPSTDEADVSFEVNVDKVGIYYIWARSAYSNIYDSYFWLSLNEADYQLGTVRPDSWGPANNVININSAMYGWFQIAQVEVTDVNENINVRIKPRRVDADVDCALALDKFVVTDKIYQVTKPADIYGNATAAPGTDYSFTPVDVNNTCSTCSTINGGKVDEINYDKKSGGNQRKWYTISNVTGDLVINGIASIDGVGYTTLEAAVEAAASTGATVTLEADATLPSNYDQAITYDLNSHTLTVTGEKFTGIKATVMDSSKGKGLLKVSQSGLAFDSDNDGYMPVWDSANNGYRFAKVTIEERVPSDTDNTEDALVFSMRPSFGSDVIEQLVATGNENGKVGVHVGVRITWTDPVTQQEEKQDLALNDSWLSTMYSDSAAPKGVKFTISGGATITEFKATTIVWSNLENCKSVEIAGTTHEYPAK